MVRDAMHLISQEEAVGVSGSVSASTTWWNKGEILMKFEGCIMTRTRGRMSLVEAGCLLAILCPVAGTWNGQGNDFFSWASGTSTPSCSDVTSCSNENPSITPFFLVAYLK
jgi:hypothetical protein